MQNLTIVGFQCDGLIFETVGASAEVPGKDTEEDMHKQNYIMCHVCAKNFTTQEEMEEHIGQVHFNSCTICERVFLRSLEKRDHIQQDHKENLGSGSG